MNQVHLNNSDQIDLLDNQQSYKSTIQDNMNTEKRLTAQSNPDSRELKRNQFLRDTRSNVLIEENSDSEEIETDENDEEFVVCKGFKRPLSEIMPILECRNQAKSNSLPLQTNFLLSKKENQHRSRKNTKNMLNSVETASDSNLIQSVTISRRLSQHLTRLVSRSLACLDNQLSDSINNLPLSKAPVFSDFSSNLQLPHHLRENDAVQRNLHIEKDQKINKNQNKENILSNKALDLSLGSKDKTQVQSEIVNNNLDENTEQSNDPYQLDATPSALCSLNSFQLLTDQNTDKISSNNHVLSTDSKQIETTLTKWKTTLKNNQKTNIQTYHVISSKTDTNLVPRLRNAFLQSKDHQCIENVKYLKIDKNVSSQINSLHPVSYMDFIEKHEMDERSCKELSDSGQRSTQPRLLVAQCTGVFGHEGGELNLPEHQVKLEIPQGALPRFSRQLIYLRVYETNFNSTSLEFGNSSSDSSQAQYSSSLPRNSKKSSMLSNISRKSLRLISPIVLCGPQGVHFIKPVYLSMPRYHRQTSTVNHGSCSSSSLSSPDIFTETESVKQKRLFNNYNCFSPALSNYKDHVSLTSNCHFDQAECSNSQFDRLTGSNDIVLHSDPLNVNKVHQQNSDTICNHRHTISLFHASAQADNDSLKSDPFLTCPSRFTFKRWHKIDLMNLANKRPNQLAIRNNSFSSSVGGLTSDVLSSNYSVANDISTIDLPFRDSFISVMIDHF